MKNISEAHPSLGSSPCPHDDTVTSCPLLRTTFFFLQLVFATIPLQYEADVLDAVFGNRSELTLTGMAAQDSLLALIALPGYFVAVALVGKLGPRFVQVRSRRWLVPSLQSCCFSQ